MKQGSCGTRPQATLELEKLGKEFRKQSIAELK